MHKELFTCVCISPSQLIFISFLERVILKIVLYVLFRNRKIFIVSFETSNVRDELVNELCVFVLGFPLVI